MSYVDVSWLCLMMLDDDILPAPLFGTSILPQFFAFPNQKRHFFRHVFWLVSNFHPASKVANVEVFKPSSIDILLWQTGPRRQSFTGEVEHLKLPLRIKEPQSWTFPRTLRIVSRFHLSHFLESTALWRTQAPKKLLKHVTIFQDGIEVFPPKRTSCFIHLHSIQFCHNSVMRPPIPQYDRKTLWLHPSWNWSKTCVRHKDVFGWCLLALGSAHQQDIYPPSMSSNGPWALTSSRNQIAWEPMFAIHGVCGSS